MKRGLSWSCSSDVQRLWNFWNFKITCISLKTKQKNSDIKGSLMLSINRSDFINSILLQTSIRKLLFMFILHFPWWSSETADALNVITSDLLWFYWTNVVLFLAGPRRDLPNTWVCLWLTDWAYFGEHSVSEELREDPTQTRLTVSGLPSSSGVLDNTGPSRVVTFSISLLLACCSR